MAFVPAFGVVSMRRQRVGRGVIEKLRVCPSVRIRESLCILFDERNRFQGVRYHHEIRGLRTLFRCPLDLRNLGAVGKTLAVSGNAAPVGIDHDGIGDDHLDPVFGLTDGDILPVFVSPELGEREPVRHSHGVLGLATVLRGNRPAAQDGEH